MKQLLWYMILLLTAHCCRPEAYVVKELDLENQAEVDGVCALFKDPENRNGTGKNPDNIKNCIQSEYNKTFISITSSMPSVVTGILVAGYHHRNLQNNQMSLFPIEWKSLIFEAHKPKFDAIHYEAIAVHPHYRRQGIASLLMQHAEQFARNMKIPYATLLVNHTNSKAIACYKRQGFQEIPNGPEDMYKKLNLTPEAEFSEKQEEQHPLAQAEFEKR